jgi:hypothetical protein
MPQRINKIKQLLWQNADNSGNPQCSRNDEPPKRGPSFGVGYSKALLAMIDVRCNPFRPSEQAFYLGTGSPEFTTDPCRLQPILCELILNSPVTLGIRNQLWSAKIRRAN